MKLLGRETELTYLNTYYEKAGSQILVIYGKKGVGKSALLSEFARNKPSFYYKARSASEREQRHQIGMELITGEELLPAFPTYTEVLQVITKEKSDKMIILIDEFQYMIRSGPDFMNELISFIHEEEKQVLVILCSSQVSFVENGLVPKIGKAAFELAGFLKIRELSREMMQTIFEEWNREQAFQLYEILGGIPAFWQHVCGKVTVKQAICNTMLEKNGSLYDKGRQLVDEELRETAIYNTILAAIAAGNNKLNQLFLHTEFSRAKISVYLKNLMELELVEKVSDQKESKDSSLKGVYQISDHMVRFYFTFLYPNLSYLDMMDSSAFYDRFIEPDLKKYMENEWEKAYL